MLGNIFELCYTTVVFTTVKDLKMRTAFIGHRQVLARNIGDKLLYAIQTEIDNGCRVFTMGTHGEFDDLALNACKRLRNNYKELEIEVVITSLNAIKKDNEYDYIPYADVKTVMYGIEDAHYKQQITISNRQMIDTCDTLICYVDTSVYRSGAKTALRYAEKRGLKIVNLYCKEEQPFYGMTKEEIDEQFENLYERVIALKNKKQ